MDFIRLPGVPPGDGYFSYSMGSLKPYAEAEPFESSSYKLALKSAVHRPSEEKGHHRRCISESNLVDKPPWFDDLLSEPENWLISTKGHRRSASDTSAYVNMFAYNIQNPEKEKIKLEDCIPCEPRNLIEKSQSSPNLQDCEESGPSLISDIFSSGIDGNAKHDQEEDNASQNKEGVIEKTSDPQNKPSIVKGDDKRAKQCRQSAHRSRIRKLQYIADLERNIQVLQVEGSEFSAALEFLDQQKFILGMENRALRQRLDNLSQEHMIKHMEQEMLEREIGRLQSIYQLQAQQQPKSQRKKNKYQINAQLTQALYHN